jgi:hypothetical protein
MIQDCLLKSVEILVIADEAGLRGGEDKLSSTS